MCGSSTINGQIAIRAVPDDIDRWAAAGCTGWSWDEILPYFCELETDKNFPNAAYHGDRGPIPVYRAPVPDWGNVDRALRASALSLDYGRCEDHNAPDGTGVSPYVANEPVTPDKRADGGETRLPRAKLAIQDLAQVSGKRSRGFAQSTRHERNIVFEFGIRETDGPAKFRGAIESHKHFHDADPVIKGFCRTHASPEGLHHMAVLIGVAVDAGFVLDNRHQALLGILLLDEVFAL
jgi:hypothetical protein